MLVLCEKRRLDEHGCDEVNAFKRLEVNLHVVRDLPAPFFNLELLGLVLLAAEALCDKFFEPHVLVQFDEYIMRLADITTPESGHSCLSQSSIVKDLVLDRLHSDHLTHVRLL